MNKYNWLLRKQSKAIDVFRQAGEKLAVVKTYIMTEISNNTKEIEEHKQEILNREDEITFLRNQHEIVDGQHKKIAAIVDGA